MPKPYKTIEFVDWRQMINWCVNVLQAEIDFLGENEPEEKSIIYGQAWGDLNRIRILILDSKKETPIEKGKEGVDPFIEKFVPSEK